MQNNNTTLVTVNLTSLLAEKDVTNLPNGDIIYSPVETTTFLPVIIGRKDGMVLVTPQDYVPEDALVQLFSDEAYNGEAAYSFPEQELVSILDEDADYITSIVGLLESYQAYNFIDADKLLKLLANLKKNAGYGIPTIMLGLEHANKEELARLFFINEQMPSNLKVAFKKLLCHIESTDADEE